MDVEQRTRRRPRKAISKRLRFEIFKRDHFTCVYCGRTPPAAVLVLDHLEAHAHGGANDETNLVTSCEECNAGKSDRPLGETLPRIGADNVAELQERVEQLRAYREWRAQFDEELRIGLDDVWQAWIDAFQGYKTDNKYESPRMPFPSENSVLEFMTRLPITEITDAVRIAAWKWRNSDIERGAVPRYFYGVMRNKVQKATEARQQISVTWDELAAQVPELAALRDAVENFSPADPWNFCGDVLWQRGWNTIFENGSRQDRPAPAAQVAGLVGPKSENRADRILGSQTAYDLALRTMKSVVPSCGQTCACGRPKRPPREADFPRCKECDQVTAPIDRRESCRMYTVTFDGRQYAAVPFGHEPTIQYCEVAQNWGRYQRLKEPKSFVPKERCSGCHTPVEGIHHPGCGLEACAVCWDVSTGCAKRDHRGQPMGMSAKQAMARLRQMKPRGTEAPPA